jgi:hypothetical protein
MKAPLRAEAGENWHVVKVQFVEAVKSMKYMINECLSKYIKAPLHAKPLTIKTLQFSTSMSESRSASEKHYMGNKGGGQCRQRPLACPSLNSHVFSFDPGFFEGRLPRFGRLSWLSYSLQGPSRAPGSSHR